MLSGEKIHLALQWLFGCSKWPFYVTRGRRHLFFFVHHFVQLLARLPIFLDKLQLAVPPMGPSRAEKRL
jgi:hypothetical protein